MNLVPNGYVHLQFPQLPDTFFTKTTGKKVPPQLEARLPSNYSKDGKFPLFVFLAGGNGGDAGVNSTGETRLMIGDRDYICVSLPLFRKSLEPHATVASDFPRDVPAGVSRALFAKIINNMWTTGIVTPADYDVINSSYAAMLAKLYEAIPNIDPARSVMAGFSNGAHTVGVLLAGKSPFVLGHFHSFCMVEGGIALALDPQKSLTPELKNHRYLVLFGDGGNDQQGNIALARPSAIQVFKDFVERATACGFDASLVIMQHTAHSFPPQYYPAVKQWAAGGSATAAPGAIVPTPP